MTATGGGPTGGRPVLVLEGVSKRYRRQTVASWRELLQARDRGSHTREVLRGVDLVVQPGQIVGVVGRNGGGKSTLLRLAAGLTRPTSGTVTRRARVSGLLTLGASESSELSGADNAVTAAVLAGLSPAQARQRLPLIAEFAELEAAMDEPVRTYSDGMRVRLAFAAAVLSDPELLLVDEVLAVGDLAFQEKCLRHIEQLREQGCAVLVASHVLDHLRRLCSEVVWLRDGVVHLAGPADEVLHSYSRAADEGAGPSVALTGGGFRRGTGGVRITAARLLDAEGNDVNRVPQGAVLQVALTMATANGSAPPPHASIALRRSGSESPLIDLTTDASGATLPPLTGPSELRLQLDRVDLEPGTYWVDHGVFGADWSEVFDYRWDCLSVVVVGAGSNGPVQPPHRWTTT